ARGPGTWSLRRSLSQPAAVLPWVARERSSVASSSVRITSEISDLPVAEVRKMLSGLPAAHGYRVQAKPLRYRSRPHLSGVTDFSAKTITLQVPEPFHPFGEVVPYGAKRRAGRGLQFIWLTEGVTFRTPRDVLRFLYCH